MGTQGEFYRTGCGTVCAMVDGRLSPSTDVCIAACPERELRPYSPHEEALKVCRVCHRREDRVGDYFDFAPEEPTPVERHRPTPTGPDPDDFWAQLEVSGASPEAQAEEPPQGDPLANMLAQAEEDCPQSSRAVYVPGQQSFVVARGDDKPSVSSLLRAAGYDSGPSTFGHSAISMAHRCLRSFFHRYIEGWVQRSPVERPGARGETKYSPLALGSLVHAMRAEYYIALMDGVVGVDSDDPKGAFGNAEAVLGAVKGVYPGLASEAYRLFRRYADELGKDDELRHDVRGVEVESKMPLCQVKVAGEMRTVLVSSKHDAIVRRMTETVDGRLPPGARASDGVFIEELKTTASISDASTRSYRHDGQMLQNAATFLHGTVTIGKLTGTAVDVFGPLDGIITTHVSKVIGKDAEASKLVKRTTYLFGEMDLQVIDEYVKTTADFVKHALASRIFGAKGSEDWPKSYLCRDVVTNISCPYLEICESCATMRPEVMFDRDTDNVITVEKITAPPAKKRGRGRPRKADVAAEAEEK